MVVFVGTLELSQVPSTLKITQISGFKSFDCGGVTDMPEVQKVSRPK